MALLKELSSRGASQDLIRVVCVVVAPPALEKISSEYSGKCIDGLAQSLKLRVYSPGVTKLGLTPTILDAG